MKINFQDNLVLTSQNPHGFLIVNRDDDPGPYYIIPTLKDDISTGELYINGIDINDYTIDSSAKALILDSNRDNAPMHVTTQSLDQFDVQINISAYNSPDLTSLENSWSVNILNRPRYIKDENINTYPVTNTQIEDETSYLILRSNPKFTGNVKLIIDSKNKLYLDTFKVSEVLSSKKYRKQSVSSESLLSNDIRSVFSDLPRGELYRLGREDVLNIETPKTEYIDQYDFEYNYGARLLQDKLYKESFSSLAPLWINKNIPEYYAIFRVDGPYNENLSQLGQKYLKQGKIVKSWGMKDNTVLGRYLRNHLNELSNIRSPVFLSLSDPAVSNPDPNTWYGIAVDKGIITGRSETPYFFDKKTHNLTEMNAFISEGFERNNLLCPNLLNLEFEFDDEEADLYSMNRYFGLYLSENELYRIAYYKETPSSDIQLISLDNRDANSFINSNIFDSSGNIQSEFENRIFTLNDVNDIYRIKNIKDFDGTIENNVSQWINKPGPNLFSAKVEQKNINPFITLNLNRPITQGEHLRVISEDENEIWEVYGIHSEYLDEGKSWPYASVYEASSYPIIYRTAFSVKGDVSTQIEAIENAFNTFSEYKNSPFYSLSRKNDSVSIFLKDNIASTYKFQRITANLKSEGEFGGIAKNNDINFFGILDPSSNDINIINYDASFGPINFEFFGNRKTITVNFIKQDSNYYYSLDKNYIDHFEDFIYYYSDQSKRYKLLENFEILTNSTYSSLYVDDPISEEEKIIIKTSEPISTINNTFNAYAVYPLTISLMGINPVKDIDYTVYDSSTLNFKSNQWYDRSDDVSTYSKILPPNSELILSIPGFYEITQGEGDLTELSSGTTVNFISGTQYDQFNTFDSSVKIKSYGNFCQIEKIQLEATRNFPSFNDSYTEENLLDYYQEPSTLLRYGLTIPYVSKWSLLGKNCRSNDLRLNLNSSIFEQPETNYIPTETAYNDEISIPVFPYIDTGNNAWESYLFYDIYDILNYNGDKKTIRDIMLENPYIDIFSKYLYFSNTDSIETRSSIVYYSDFKNSIDTIFNGLNFSISLENFATNIFDVQNWNNYRFSFISTPSPSREINQPIELIINENTQTIIMIWYQGNDDLNYNRRESDTTIPKGLINNKNSQISFNGPITNSSLNYYTKAPYIIETDKIVFSVYSKYLESGNGNIQYEINESTPFSQFNIHSGFYKRKSIFNFFKNGYVNINNIFSPQGVTPYLFHTMDPSQNINYIYEKFSSSYDKERTVNTSFLYNKKENFYKTHTTKYNDLKYILDNNFVSYKFIRNNIIYDNQNFQLKPINITLNPPREYSPENSSTSIKTYNGWFRPIFKNILRFQTNENQDIIETFQRDFILSNTNLREYNKIDQLWYNEVVNEITQEDVSRGNAINYKRNFDVFKSSWDKNFYILSQNTGKANINGFNSPYEIPSFFGSKLINLPNKIQLTEWNNINTNIIEREDIYELEFNISNAITNLFKNINDFTDNWKFPNKDTLIDQYIKRTILNYYRINYNSIDVNLYTKVLQEEDNILSLTQNNHTFNNNKNINGRLIYRNGQHYYIIEVDKDLSLSYYVSFNIYER